MKPNWKKFWAEASAFGLAVYYFLVPSLQAYVLAHPKTTIGALLGALIAMGLKKSPFDAPTQ